MITISPYGSRRSKWVPSSRGVFLRLLLGELGTPKLTQSCACGKWLYPYRMLLHGVSDLDERCLKTCRLAVVAFLEGSHQIFLPPIPKIPFWRSLNCKTYYERSLCKSHVDGAMKLKLYIGIGKYLSVCQDVSARGRLGGLAPPSVHLGPP